MKTQLFFHLLWGDRADQVLLSQPGALQVHRLQVQQSHGVKDRPVTVSVHQNFVPGAAQEREPRVEPHRGTPSEKLTELKAKLLRPEGLGRVKGLAGAVQISRPGDLGHIQSDGGRQL